MLGVTFFGNVDLASVAIWMFWLFFAGLIYYLCTEGMREGYPLEDEGSDRTYSGLFSPASDKTFDLPHGRGKVVLPSGQRGDRADLAMAPSSKSAGSAYIPTGDPMVDGVGPAAWAPRRNLPELDAHGHAKLRPLSSLPEFHFSGGRDPRGKAVVGGDGEVVGRVIDMWVDVPEQMVRYLTVDLNPEGTGQTRLVPLTMAKIKSDRVTVRALHAHNFAGIPTIAGAGEVTLLEEEKIVAYVAGGTLYANPARAEPVI